MVPFFQNHQTITYIVQNISADDFRKINFILNLGAACFRCIVKLYHSIVSQKEKQAIISLQGIAGESLFLKDCFLLVFLDFDLSFPIIYIISIYRQSPIFSLVTNTQLS